MKKIIIRSITGIIFVSLVVLSIVSTKVILLNVFLLFTCIGLYEYRNLLKIKRINLSLSFFVIALIPYFIIGYVDLWKYFPSQLLLFLLFGVILLSFIIELFRKNEKYPFTNLSYSTLGILWIAFPLALVNYIPTITPNGQMLLLSIFIIIWLYDTLAYCIGSLIGKHPLFERISPKKTWEGAVGSVLCTLIITFFFTIIFSNIPLSQWEWMGLALTIIITGTLGDLIESMFKRQIEVKDSGTILPGHGGILDRLDSVLIAIPFALIYLQIVI
jgi:phosphatidate cytidylyltransferase